MRSQTSETGVAHATLRRDLSRSIRGGHPWVYREALAAPAGLESGSVVEIREASGRFLARGLYDPASPIALRIYSLDENEPVDDQLFARRLARALSLRQTLLRGGLDETNAFRLCNGEGDLLPGVVVDVYGPVAVVIFDGGERGPARTFAPAVTGALVKLLSPLGVGAIYERLQRRDGGGGQLLWGALPHGADGADGGKPGEVVVKEHGVRFHVDIVHGQKSGLFLDQRENRRRVRELAAGRSVWNGFAYTGGFSVYAALGGARRVVSVDVAAPAIAAARRNFTLNGIDANRHGFFSEDAFTHLAAAAARGERHDLVIVDPPSFAKAERDVPAALSAYRELHGLALQLVAPGGLLCAASCSSHVPEVAFLTTLVSVGKLHKKERRTRLLEVFGQPLDHPSPPAFPEGRYLKFALLAVD